MTETTIVRRPGTEAVPLGKRLRRIAVTVREASYPILAVLAALVVWELFVRLAKIPIYLLPPPTLVLEELIDSQRSLLLNTWPTLQEILLGFALSVIVGVPLALGIATWHVFEKTVYPLLVASQVVPKIAIAPLFVVWFGFGMAPKVLVAFLIGFFPIVINTVIGLLSVEIEKLYLARSMGANGFQIFTKIKLPNAMPNVFGGLKLSITFCVIGAIVGEFIGADAGLGRLLLIANGNLDTKLLFATVVVLTILGVALFLIMDAIERIALPWHAAQRARVAAASGTI